MESAGGDGAAARAADAARDALEEGLAAFAARDLCAAHAGFERAYRRDPRNALHMSWYGVTLVLVERNSNLGAMLAEDALRTAGPDPVLLLNTARIHLALNQRKRAAAAIARGLERWPDNPCLLAARDAMGARRTPPIPFLRRSNPLNRVLGRLRHRWSHRDAPSCDLSPVTLGIPAGGVATPEEN